MPNKSRKAISVHSFLEDCSSLLSWDDLSNDNLVPSIFQIKEILQKHGVTVQKCETIKFYRTLWTTYIVCMTIIFIRNMLVIWSGILRSQCDFSCLVLDFSCMKEKHYGNHGLIKERNDKGLFKFRCCSRE